MSAFKQSNNLAARMGRWSARHKKAAIFGWLGFIVLTFVLGNAIGTKQLEDSKSGTGESGHVQSVLADEFAQPPADTVLIQSKAATADDPAVHAAVTDVVRTASRLQQVQNVRSPFDAANPGLISADRHSAMVTFELRTTDAEQAKILDEPVEQAIARAATRHPGMAVELFGVNAEKQLDDAVVSDFKKAG